MKQVAVIGGGASGLVAALFASQGNRVVLFEKQKKIGRKILITGNGRCNLSNSQIDLKRYHGRNPKFVLNLFSRFGLDETISFFESIGVPLIEKSNGRIFPASLQASTIVRVLEYELLKRGVDIKLHRRIDTILPEEKKIKLITAGRESYYFDSIILATGSCAFSPVGASKIGYRLASSLGHTVHEPFPSILPVNIPLKIVHRLEGIRWDCRAMVELNGGIIAQSEGELLFTKYGISGPVALDISRAINEHIIKGREPEIVIDLLPELKEEEVSIMISRLWEDTKKSASFSLIGLLHHRMPAVLLEIAGVDPEKKVVNLSKNERESILRILKYLRLKPGEPRSFNEAVVAAGGVDIDEVDPATMESRITKNIYITGELLDIDGDSGGYNLQFAWSSGAVAGMSQ